jgi:hypothetical protein
MLPRMIVLTALFPLLTTGCGYRLDAPDAPTWSPLGSYNPAPPEVLVLTATELVSGEPAELQVSGLDAAEEVWFALSIEVGPGPCLSAFGGLCLDLVGPMKLGSATASLGGTAVFTLTVPDHVAVGTGVGLQALVNRGDASVATSVLETVLVDAFVDGDADGFGRDVDCDDGNPDIHPGATEVCDGVDNDCDAGTSEDGKVTLDGHSNYDTIADAVSHAPSHSEITVCEGTYDEDVLVDVVGLTIRAPHGPEDTIVRSVGSYLGALHITASEVTVDGMSVQGSAYGSSGLTLWSNDIVVQNCRVEDNEGKGIRVLGADALILDTVITGCGTAIDLGYMDSARGERLEIIDNYGVFGGAVQLHNGSDLVLVDSVVHSNRAPSFGGGVYIWDSVWDPSGRFEAINCDFGVDATENLPDDAFVGATDKSYRAFAADASFVCTDSSCG